MASKKLKRSKRKSTKLVKFLISLSIGVVLIFGLISFKGNLSTQPQNHQISDPENWSNYSNSHLGFSFDFPSYLGTYTDNLATDFSNAGSTTENLPLSMGFEGNKNHLDVYLDSRLDNKCQGKLIYIAKRSGSGITFTSHNGFNFSLSSNSCTDFYETRIDLDKNNFITLKYFYDKNNVNAQADFEKILSTFKFIPLLVEVTPTPIPFEESGAIRAKYFSPDGRYTLFLVIESAFYVKDNETGKLTFIPKNGKDLDPSKQIKGMSDQSFLWWIDNHTIRVKVLSADGHIFEYNLDVSTGLADIGSFVRIK